MIIKNNKFTRSTNVSLKFANKNKKLALYNILREYKDIVNKFIILFWELEKIPKFASSNLYKQVESNLSAYITQCAAKQALGIVKGTKKKQEKRIFIHAKLLTENKIKQARKLKQIIDSIKLSCPILNEIIPMEIGGNPTVTKINLDNKTIFDGWIYLSNGSRKKKQILNLPFKRTKHFNKLYENGKIATGCRISLNKITFSFEIKNNKEKYGKVVGIDIGYKNSISCSDGQQQNNKLNNHNLESIQKILTRKKKGSKAFFRAQLHRKNFINWSINQLDLSNISTVKRENIKNLRKGKRCSRLMSSWTYTDIFEKLDRYCQEQNVSVIKISPTYTSQRCSVCGWTRKKNRNGKLFKCDQCTNTLDADLNASINISLNLMQISTKERQLQKNKIGFYWYEIGQESIVPDVKRNKR